MDDKKYKYHPLKNAQVAVTQQLQQSSFRPNLTVNLTLRENPLGHLTNLWDKGLTQTQFGIIEGCFSRFYNHLAKACYGRNWKRLSKKNNDKELKIFGTIEVSKNQQFHLHCAALIPAHLTEDEFIKRVKRCWAKIYYASNHVDNFEIIYYVDGWVSYISKHLNKHNSMGYISYSKL
ncbi:MAG: hypothetical protein COB83_05810 [Gammaproteobacteria bacterium]|nr:MAG: hypothetical protein COB83_05810 [Gammaproteobacteria bacterium]